MPPPKPKWGRRSPAVMSNPATASPGPASPASPGSVPADSQNRWIVVPALMASPSKVKSAVASRLPQLGTLGQEPPLGRVIQERLHGQAELVAGGVEAAEDQQYERIAQLGRGQARLARPTPARVARSTPARLARPMLARLDGLAWLVGLRPHQAGHEVIPGAALPVGNQRVGVVVQRRERRLDPRQVLT